MKKSTIISFLLGAAIAGFGFFMGFKIGSITPTPPQPQNAPIAVDLPEEWGAISRDSNHPEHMDVFFDRDTLRLQFVPKEEQNQRQGEYQLTTDVNGISASCSQGDSIREVGFIKWNGKRKVEGIEELILKDNL